MRTKKLPRSRVVDMTMGDPIRLILLFAIPLFIGNIFQQIYTVVDTAVVGHVLGDSAISAIGATSSLYSFMITLSSGMNSGYAIITTQAFGAHDNKKLRESVAGMFLLNAVASFIVTLIFVVALEPLLQFMNTPDTIFGESYNYLFVLCLGMITTIGYNMFASILRAVGNSRTPLYHLIIACIVNVVLDIVFVAFFDMGVTGAALATVIAQGISAVCSGYSLFKNYREMIPDREDYRDSLKLYGELIYSGASMALMLCVVNIGSIIFARAINNLGDDIIAAHSSSHKIFTLFLQPISTVATAMSTFVSQNKGARRFDRIKSTLRNVMLLQIAWGTFSCLIVYLFGAGMVKILTGTENTNIISNAVMSMRICLPFFPVLGVLQCLRTSMQAMGSKITPVLSSGVELLMKWLGAITLIPAYGYIGACVTEPLTWSVMTVFLVISYMILKKKIFSEQ